MHCNEAEVPWVNRSPSHFVRDHIRLTTQPFDGPDDLASVLQAALDDPEGLEPLRKAARNRARSRYGWDGVVDAWEELFRRLAR